MSNATSPSSPSAAAGVAGITGSLPDSTTLKIEIAVFAALAFWNSIELVTLIFLTFKRYSGLYFWSLLIASAGIIPYCVGFLVKYFTVSAPQTTWIGCLLLTVGWWSMVTGQSVVLWSRLHLVLGKGRGGQRILRWSLIMIIVNACILHIPTTTLTWLDNYATRPEAYVKVFNVFEKLQMTGFFVQEMILSSLYIAATSKILRTSLKQNTRQILYQLVIINVIIMAGDISLLGVEYANYYIIETMWKPVLYSLKLKLEFAVLSKLVKFVKDGQQTVEQGRKKSIPFNDAQKRNGSLATTTVRSPHAPQGRQNTGFAADADLFAEGDVSEFVDMKRLGSDVTHAASFSTEKRHWRPRPSAVGPLDTDETDIHFAAFQHLEDGSEISRSQEVGFV